MAKRMLTDYQVLATGEKFRFGESGPPWRKLSDTKCVCISTGEEYQIRKDVPTYVYPAGRAEYEHEKG